MGDDVGDRAGSCRGERLIDLYRRSYLDMVRLATLLVDAEDVAEELVQDCFVGLHRNWADIEHPESYLRASVVNRCRSELRRRRLRRRPAQADPTRVVEPPEMLLDALAKLPWRQRAALVMRFYQDLDDEAIAEALAVRPATVRSLIHRGLTRLREVITP